MKSPLKAAALQMATSRSICRNVEKLCAAVDEAAHADADLLVVPGCALSGYPPARNLDFDLLQEAQQNVAAHAASKQLWLALGTTTRRGDAWFNTALLFSPTGERVASYDKTELMPNERAVFTPGDALTAVRVGEWKVGLQICFDMRFPESWRILRRQGAELVLHLSNASGGDAWKVPVLDGTVRCRAAENGMFVVSANDARRPQMMVSAVCDPDGKHLACAEENREMIIYAELDRTALRTDFLDARRTDLWSRPELWRLLLE